MKIIELKLNAENIEELKKFYVEKLGAECTNSNTNYFTITAGTSKLTFLKDKTREKLWWGNEETFAAVGDENGLLIVVPTSRNWFPSDKPSSIYPITLFTKGSENKMVSLEGYPYRIIIKESNEAISTFPEL